MVKLGAVKHIAVREAGEFSPRPASVDVPLAALAEGLTAPTPEVFANRKVK
ncbi:hypothetical protein GCM10010185_69860 [Saccharothrix coeruleofusca]|uniref:Uncharacterized protein n=1 Tax=Saccharothrix coeruleofusca TaxID=33919 RepID=A0A918AU92_9PSEU|nr:hypothetical protein GCM10010185_69860 [Saccharothrix coeruleofusca]